MTMFRRLFARTFGYRFGRWFAMWFLVCARLARFPRYFVSLVPKTIQEPWLLETQTNVGGGGFCG